MRSKETTLLSLFFNQPTREWHFEELFKDAAISRSKAAGWLRKFQNEGLIRKVKMPGRMPHYLARHDAAPYRHRKRLFGQQMLYESGLLNHLSGLGAKCVIIFGSFARSDWHAGSDIDLFIYGEAKRLSLLKYELALQREIQVFACRNSGALRKFSGEFLKNLMKGIRVKGDIDFVKVNIDARIFSPTRRLSKVQAGRPPHHHGGD